MRYLPYILLGASLLFGGASFLSLSAQNVSTSSATPVKRKVKVNITVQNRQGTPQKGMRLFIPGVVQGLESDEQGVLSFDYEYNSASPDMATLRYALPSTEVAKTFSMNEEMFTTVLTVDSPDDIKRYKEQGISFPVQGIVVTGSGTPIAGATLSLRGTTIQTRSAGDGSFTLAVDYNHPVIVRADGYENQVLTIDQLTSTDGKPRKIYLYAQNTEKVYHTAKRMPSFTGGMKAMMQYFQERQRSIASKGVVVVQFVVEKDGSLTSPTVVRPLSAEANAEALRLVTEMPSWTPASNGQQAVRCRYSIPITFPVATGKNSSQLTQTMTNDTITHP